METQQLHRGRLIDHLQLVVRDVDASRRFYEAALGVLGIPIGGDGDDWFWADELFVSSAGSEAAQGTLTGRQHFAFQARNRAMVDAFHAAALAHGGRDNGAPGERPYHPGYYAAFVLDPDGNNIEAVHHGEAERSADSVVVTFAESRRRRRGRVGRCRIPDSGRHATGMPTGSMWRFPQKDAIDPLKGIPRFAAMPTQCIAKRRGDCSLRSKRQAWSRNGR